MQTTSQFKVGTRLRNIKIDRLGTVTDILPLAVGSRDSQLERFAVLFDDQSKGVWFSHDASRWFTAVKKSRKSPK